ncbi:MAG: type IV secretory system conjugative DNA transfer family protein [Clostridia bacterium]|nr:type IV secretory system conjugative DNA transfer family protein [Clostridia bacterium]
MDKKQLLAGYENMILVHHEDLVKSPDLVPWDDLPNRAIPGVLKADFHVDGKLMQLYTKQENHVGIIAATRQGKTTSYIVPQILSFARQKVKRPMIITDPKGEIYRITAKTLEEQGYKVLLLNFRDYKKSECWNPFRKIYRSYLESKNLEDEVEAIFEDGRYKCRFNGEIFTDQAELDSAIEAKRYFMESEVAAMIDDLAAIFIPLASKEPIWDYGGRDIFKGVLWGLLEDIDYPVNPVTEDKFSLSTVLTVIENIIGDLNGANGSEGFFTRRDIYTSRAYTCVKSTLFIAAKTTRDSYVTTLRSSLGQYYEISTRMITSCNSFDIRDYADGKTPVAVFIDFRDELKNQYVTIARFVQDMYKTLIEEANKYDTGKLPVPWYFVLDEFGNFPEIPDFETVISACAGRNIWFMLVLQSYAQLACIYNRDGADRAKIIRDNMNVTVFFGSNNLMTIKEFSEECGECTRIAPNSAMSGTTPHLTSIEIEKRPLVPKSMLAAIKPGECVIREVCNDQVWFTKLERYYAMPEMNALPKADAKEYVPACNPMQLKYRYEFYVKSHKEEEEDDD